MYKRFGSTLRYVLTVATHRRRMTSTSAAIFTSPWSPADSQSSASSVSSSISPPSRALATGSEEGIHDGERIHSPGQRAKHQRHKKTTERNNCFCFQLAPVTSSRKYDTSPSRTPPLIRTCTYYNCLCLPPHLAPSLPSQLAYPLLHSCLHTHRQFALAGVSRDLERI